MLFNFTFAALPGLLLIAMGIKAMTPAGIQLTESRTLSRRTSTIIGILTLLMGIGTIGAGFFVIVFPHL
jgi:hypothetical protein